jgi:tRNA threonylcarbamoyladenosine biosynthesis protein TsaE
MMTLLHQPILESCFLHWSAESDCADFAQRLALQPALGHAYIELLGPLGAGKTTFVRHLLRALGVEGRIKSPTFTVLEPYRSGTLEISHFDFYRFADPREWVDAGFRDIFARDGLKLAEWPQKAAGQLPQADLGLEIEVLDESQRRVRLHVGSALGARLLAGGDP